MDKGKKNISKSILLFPVIISVSIVVRCDLNSPLDSDLSSDLSKENDYITTKVGGMIYCKNECQNREDCGYCGASGVSVTCKSRYLLFHDPKGGVKNRYYSEYRCTTFTDANGYYEASLPAGEYVCEAYATSGHHCIIGNSRSIDGFPLLNTTYSNTINVNDTLQPQGSLRLNIDSVDDCKKVIIKIPTFNQAEVAYLNGNINTISLPAERYNLDIISYFENFEYHDTVKNIEIGPGKEISLNLSEFIYRRIHYHGNLNTVGNPPVDEKKYHIGDTCSISGNTGNMRRTGFDFVGWNTKEDGSGELYLPDSPFYSFSIGSNDFYAQWQPQGMVLIPAKNVTFIMGNSNGNQRDQKPAHPVKLTADFWMDTTEITQLQYKTVMSAVYPAYRNTRWKKEYGLGDNYPAYYINWYDAVLFCNARTKVSGSSDTVYSYSPTSLKGIPGDSCKFDGVFIDLNKRGFCLPTDAQWEFACRAQTTTLYYFDSLKINDYAWHGENSDGTTHPVAQKLKNAFNLYDMCGNVWEWCSDGHRNYDPDSSQLLIDPMDYLGTERIMRGGSIYNPAGKLQSAYRGNDNPYEAHFNYGLRTCFPAQ